MKLLSDVRLLLLGLWLGAAVFMIAVAQSAFAVLPTHEAAGTLVSRTLAILNYSGLGIAIVLLLSSMIVAAGTRRIVVWAERTLLILMAVACAVAQFVFAWWMLLLRTQMGRPIDEVAADDPLRVQFNNLHQYSTSSLIIAMAAGLIAFFIIANRRVAPVKKTGPADFDFSKQFKI